MAAPARVNRVFATRPLPRLVAVLVCFVLLVAACSGDTATTEPVPATDVAADSSPTDVEADADAGVDADADAAEAAGASLPTPTAVPTATPAPEPTSTEQSAGDYAGPFDAIEPGECWNNGGDTRGVVPVAVPCEGRHMHETFARGEAPWGPTEVYPGEDVLAVRMLEDLCEPATIQFAGALTDVVPIRTWLWYPGVEDWNAGDRTVLCTVGTSSADREAPFKVGTAAAGTLTSDDAIVARGVVDGATDLYLSRQSGILYRITSGGYRVALAPPQILETGLLFTGSAIVDDLALASLPWFVDYEDPTSVATLTVGDLAGWEISDAQFAVGVAATVFAARETEDDDWDIYLSADDGAVALTDNPGDDRWPRLLPDESAVVYNADGRLWVMDLDGRNRRPITDDEGGPDFEPAVAPDGTRIAFTSGRSGVEDIWTVNLDGTGLRNLTAHPSTDSWPFWSLDGERIYWQTDRLGVSSHIMVMTADGDNGSYFSVELLTQGAVLPADAAALIEQAAVPLDGRARLPGEGNFNQIPGEPGELGGYEHSSGRISVGLPAGWEVVEIDTGRAAQFIAAERIDTFSQTWAIDGIMISLIDDNDAVWRSAIASADANRCVEDVRSETPSESPSGDALAITTIEFACGDAAAWIVAVRNEATETGLLLEAQFDLSPSREADEAWIVEVAQNVVWG